jgi:hypothetical protein
VRADEQLLALLAQSDMRNLFRFGAFVLLLFSIVAVNAATGTNGVDPRIAPGGITLKQALEKGLKARRPSEFAFIRLVVKKVEQGALPRKMVERTFLWARNNKQPYPMPYFERALQIQAKKLGVDLPFTDT